MNAFCKSMTDERCMRRHDLVVNMEPSAPGGRRLHDRGIDIGVTH